MTYKRTKLLRRLAVLALFALAPACVSETAADPAFQRADVVFSPTVAHPTYAEAGPSVVIDEAHNNYHTATGRYRAFATLIERDGYRVAPDTETFSADALRDTGILVIANAAGGENEDEPDEILAQPAFSAAAIAAVREWVAGGGSLLLVADHYPAGGAAQGLAAAFGVDMSNSWTFDADHAEPGQGPYTLAFSRSNGLLAEHPITHGRNAEESIDKVVAFTGQSLLGPEESAPLLILAPSAMDEDVTETIRVSAAGRVQGLAIEYGQGRVVVLGEAAMLTAQETMRDGAIRRFGMSYEHSDDQQFALNVMHWLSRVLD